jgi:hypothetical protein
MMTSNKTYSISACPFFAFCFFVFFTYK